MKSKSFLLPLSKEKKKVMLKKKFYFLTKKKDPNRCPGNLPEIWTKALTKMTSTLQSSRVQTHRDLPGHHRWLMLCLQQRDDLYTDFKN